MNSLSKLALVLTFCSGMIACSGGKAVKGDYGVVPLPQEVTLTNGNPFVLSPSTKIFYPEGNDKMKKNAEFLASYIKEITGYELATATGQPGKGISLVIDQSIQNPEGYQLTVSDNGIRIAGSTDAGVFYGIQTLRKSIPATAQGMNVELPAATINDYPRFAYRGMMLDVSRHFFPVDSVKTYLDILALHNQNTFHWHLSDDQGWRIEIKKYPELTQIGSKRKETVIGHNSGTYDGKEYGGFYTQDQIRDVINYAAERHITIIPEIDMPGHASAASKAYPEFSGGGSPKYPGYTYNPGKDSVYTYLTDILKEVDALFPSQVIHLGGDEVHYGNQDWNTNKDIQDLMKHEKMKNLKDVENYFFQRMADSLLLIHNKVAAWDEVADSQLSPEHTIVFFWRQNRPEQLQKSLDRKFNIVLCPRLPMYLDYAQDTLQVHGVDWRKFSYNYYQKVYSFSPQDIPVKYPKNCNILGIQANLWTERIETEDRLDYMLFPRMAALAENAWTKEKNKNINSFNIRLKKQFNLYKKDHIYYSDPFTPKETGEPVR